jgi:hypothetical protein
MIARTPLGGSGSGAYLSRRAFALGASGVLIPSQVLANVEQTPLEAGDERLDTGSDAVQRLTLPVLLNGRTPTRLVVDSGANRTVLSVELAQALGLEPGPITRIHGIAGVEPAPTAARVQLQFGRELQVSLTNVPLLSAGKIGAAGLLGLDAVKDRRVVFDFARGALEIRRSSRRMLVANDIRADAVTVRGRQKAGQLTVVDASAARQKMEVFIDTGAEWSVGNRALQRVTAAWRNRRGFSTSQVMLHGATGDRMVADLDAAPPMKIGELSIGAFRLPFADLHTFRLWGLEDRPAMVVGMDLLRRFKRVELDFGAAHVSFYSAVDRQYWAERGNGSA